MGFLLLCCVILTILIFIFLSFRRRGTSVSSHSNLPPGNMGFPFIGESIDYIKSGRNGHPEDFIFKRISKFCPQIFKTCILGEPTVVLCGASGNKFLFSNEDKLVTAWWPNSLTKIFPSKADVDGLGQESKKMRKMLPNFLNPEALKRYISTMDSIAQDHFQECWEGRQNVTVYPLSMRFTFHLACKLFLSMEDTEKVTKFGGPFHILSSGIFSFPINFPGTAFNRAIKASIVIRDEIASIIKQRKMDLAEKKDSPVRDILTHMLLTVDEDGQYSSESDIANRILALLLGGHDTASSVVTSLVNYLAELPEIYNQVYMEQMEIAKSKRDGEFLNWDDIQKMKYSWNVACEVMRLAPPLQGTFRMAMIDFNFAGFSIPKGWKLYWSTYATHKNPEYFPEPKKFEPSRFEGNGPIPYSFVPFGGGPRMCPGKEYARLEILVFMHNLVKRYKWEKLLPHGKITMNPLPTPAKGLPIRLIPHRA